jgi:endonuclease-8
VHRAARRLRKALQGKELEEVGLYLDHLEPWQPLLPGETVDRVEARGKAFLIHFSLGAALYVHLQLYGRWQVKLRHNYPDSNRSLRAELHSEKKMALLYSASDVVMLTPEDEAAHPYLCKLGPDPLNADTTFEAVRDQVTDPRFRRRRLGGLLLDQGYVAGMGNYLRSEVLFEAGLSPELRPGDLSLEQSEALSLAVWQMQHRSFRTGGITAPDELVAAGKARRQPRRVWRHLVFSRAGKPCPRCAEPIEKRTVGGRRLYWCPACQG